MYAGITVRPLPPLPWSGWWLKGALFSRDFLLSSLPARAGRVVLYLDLDTVLVSSLAFLLPSMSRVNDSGRDASDVMHVLSAAHIRNEGDISIHTHIVPNYLPD